MISTNPDSAKKTMLITSTLHRPPAGGRELLCKLNHDLLKDIYGSEFISYELHSSGQRYIKSLIGAASGHIDGLDTETIDKIFESIEAENVGKLFVDGSNLGEFVKAAKRRFPKVEVSTFFHNVESRFFLGSLRQSRTPRALAVLVANYLAERKAVRYSDKIICLSQRDSLLLERIYGRPATHLSPMALQESTPQESSEPLERIPEKYALFVGGGFYANRAGIAWFVEHVVPRIGIQVCIIGRGLDDLKPQLEREGKVILIGAVDSVAHWYCNAQFVIAPIFDGSGMKTKVAEALMFGKRIVGTPEAFSGYEDVAEHAGWVCTTADDFVAAIDQAQGSIVTPFDAHLRRLYEEKYSYHAAKARLRDIMSTAP